MSTSQATFSVVYGFAAFFITLLTGCDQPALMSYHEGPAPGITKTRKRRGIAGNSVASADRKESVHEYISNATT
jgi:hypothetical protein